MTHGARDDFQLFRAEPKQDEDNDRRPGVRLHAQFFAAGDAAAGPVMNMVSRRYGLILVGAVVYLLFGSVPGHGFAPYPSHYRWYSLYTDNFAIHFPLHLEEQANQTAKIAEEVHGALYVRYGWTPRGRTQVVLSDHLDFSNAMATSFPYNTVLLMLRPAAPGEELANYREWLHLLFTHEYAHILHLDQARGPNRMARSFFGRIITPWTFPNWFSPQWLIEGLATYEETQLTGRGRTGSSHFEMIVRMAALEKRFPTLARMDGFQASWPGGQNRYVFGAEFLRYIAESRGEEGLYEQARDYAGRTLPFRLNASFGQAIGDRPGSLWREWKSVVEQQAAAVSREVKGQGETPGRPLTERGYRIGGARFSGDGRLLAYTEAGAREYPALRLLDLESGEDRRLAEAMGATGLSFSPDGRLLAFSRWERFRSYELYSDLYLYELDRRRVRRLTRGARLRDGDFHPREQLLVAVREGEATTALVLVDPASGESKPLREEDEPVVYGRPRWSPDGRLVAVAAWRRGTTGLEIIAVESGESKRFLERAGNTPAWPVWSADGEHLYLTLDLAAIHNIYRLHLATGTLARVTNVVGGAFEPALCPRTGRLVFSDYSSRGYDLRLLEEHGVVELVEPLSPPEAKEPARPEHAGLQPLPPGENEDFLSEDPRRQRYRAGSTLLPRAWFPVASVDEQGQNYGFTVWSADPLQRHQFEGTALYGTTSERWAGAAVYRNHWLHPVLELRASDFAFNHGNLWTPPPAEEGHRPLPDYWERRRSLRAMLIVPMLRLRWGVTGRAGVLEQRLAPLRTFPVAEEPPARGVLRGAMLGVAFDNREWPGLAVSPERGVLAEASWSHFDESLGGDFNLDELLFEWRTFVPLPYLRHHVLGWWVKGGVAEGDQLPQRRFQLGGFGTPEELLGESTGIFPLRGYPQAVQRGDRILRSTIEYRFPLVYHESGPAVFPLFLDRSHLTVFAEAGAAWDGSWRRENRIKPSIGVEYKLDMVLARLLPLALRIGLAYRLDDTLEEEERSFVYLGFGHQF